LSSLIFSPPYLSQIPFFFYPSILDSHIYNNYNTIVLFFFVGWLCCKRQETSRSGQLPGQSDDFPNVSRDSCLSLYPFQRCFSKLASQSYLEEKTNEKKYIIDNVSDIKVCTFVSNKNSWNPLSLSLVPPPLFRGYFVIVNFLLKTKLKKTNRNYVEVAVNALNFVIIKFLPLNVTRLNPFIFFFRPFRAKHFFPRPLFFFTSFFFFFSDCFFLFHYYFQTLAVT
jgi:hypothetical protein